jgi:hypothetical protein
MLLTLALGLGSACDGSPGAEPCEEGPFSLTDGTRFLKANEAISAASQGDGLVKACAGEYPVGGGLYPAYDQEIEGASVSLLGAGPEATSLYFDGESGHSISSDTLASLSLIGLTLAPSTDTQEDPNCGAYALEEGEWERSPYCGEEGDPWSIGGVEGTVLFERVNVIGSSAFYGGSLGLSYNMETDPYHASAITFRDCVIQGNTALRDSVGGAILVSSEDVTLISENTDWGAGDDDNTPDDIAFTHTEVVDREEVVVVDAQYRFDGLASFTCDSNTAICE